MKTLIPFFSALAASPLFAQILVLPPPDVDLIGEIQTTVAIKGDSLLDIARRYDLGQDEIVLANPDVDRWLPSPG